MLKPVSKGCWFEVVGATLTDELTDVAVALVLSYKASAWSELSKKFHKSLN